MWVVHVDFVAHRGYVIEAEDEDQAVEIAETLNTRPSHSWEVENVEEAPEDAEPDNVLEDN